jgi:hypothetical protein
VAVFTPLHKRFSKSGLNHVSVRDASLARRRDGFKKVINLFSGDGTAAKRDSDVAGVVREVRKGTAPDPFSPRPPNGVIDVPSAVGVTGGVIDCGEEKSLPAAKKRDDLKNAPIALASGRRLA